MGPCPHILCYVFLIEAYHHEANRNPLILGNVRVMERDLSFLSALSIGFYLFTIISPLCALLGFACISNQLVLLFSQLVRRQCEDIVLTSNLLQNRHLMDGTRWNIITLYDAT